MKHYRRSIPGSTEDGEFIAASSNPTLAVKLSVLIPGLLQAAAAKSTALLTHVSRYRPSSSSDGHSRSSAKGDTTDRSSAKGTDSRGVPAVAMESITLADFEKDTRQIYLAIGALNRTARLPAQQVLDHFASPTAAEQYVGWMEDLAGRILQYSQQPGSSSPRTSNASVMARVVAGRLPPWQAFAFGLLKLWALMPMLHFQCMLAAGLRTATDNQQAANSTRSSSSSSRGATSSGSKQTRSTSSGGGGNATGSRSKQTANAAARQGSIPWSWAPMEAEKDLESAVSLQVQTAWLRPNLLRLQHAWQHHVQAEHVAMAVNMQNAAQAWALVQRAPSLHPAVVQLGSSGPAVAAAVMQLGSGRLAELQEIAWSYLATGSALLRQQVLPQLLRVPDVGALLHPTLLRCPSYHKGHRYSPALLSALAHGNAYLGLPGAYEGHLVEAEVWDLLPWQLELLQAMADKEQRALRNSSSSNNNNSSNLASSAFAASFPTNSSATMTAATTGPGSNRPAPPWLGEAFWPLLPYAATWRNDRASSSSPAGGTSTRPAAEASCQLPPVSADQLRLALERVCLNVHLCTRDAHTSLMLMVLLLLRADPALRQRFLQGPQGGLLLAALQLYGCGTGPLQEVVNILRPGLAPAGSDGWLHSEGAGLEGLQEVLAPTTSNSSLGASTTAALALSWLLLQPSSTASWASLQVDMVPGTVVCFDGPGQAAGGLSLINLPATALQLRSGYAPDLQLAATLETLLLHSGDPSLLLGALADAYQEDPTRAPSPDSPMWLALASMAVQFRKRSAAAAQSARGAPVRLDTDMHWLSYQLPLLRLAVVAQQQPGAGWGALVLGSAVQGTALACCAAAIRELRGIAAVMGDSSSRQAMQLGITQALVVQQAQHLQRSFLDIADGCRCMFGLQGQTCDANDGAAVTLAETAAGAASVTTADGPCTAQFEPSSPAPPTAAAHAAPVTEATAMTVAHASPTRSGPSQGGRVYGMYHNPLWLLLEVRDLLATLHSTWPKEQAAVVASPSTVTPAPAAVMAAAVQAAGRASSSPPARAAAGSTAASAVQLGGPVAATSTPGLQAAKGVRPSVSEATSAAAMEDQGAAPLQATGAAGAPFPAPTSACASSLGNSSTLDRAAALAVIEDIITLSGCCEAVGACAQLCSGSRLQLLGCANLGCTTPLEPALDACEASAVVNRKGSVCGGCGVVRYSSTACAQQDWAGHRRVCRRLAAAAAVRGASKRTGGVN